MLICVMSEGELRVDLGQTLQARSIGEQTSAVALSSSQVRLQISWHNTGLPLFSVSFHNAIFAKRFINQ